MLQLALELSCLIFLTLSFNLLTMTSMIPHLSSPLSFPISLPSILFPSLSTFSISYNSIPFITFFFNLLFLTILSPPHPSLHCSPLLLLLPLHPSLPFSSFQINPMTEKKEVSDPDTPRLCEMRIQKITSLGGIPVLAK